MIDGWIRGVVSFAVLLLVGMGGNLSYVVAQDTAQKDLQKPGSITGVVVDAQKGEPLPGANVTIKGTTTGTTTDLKGRYRLDGLEPGTYDVVFSFVGFQKKTVTGVEVKPGKATTIEVTLAQETAQLDEVVIKAKAARDSEAGMLEERAKAASMSNAISAEAMSQAGISSAAGAMKKVTGASVVDGKYVYIRGLGDRYTTTLLNGIKLPTASADRNAVQFDLFSANLLSNITTKKTFTPDQPGSFAGGLINIQTESYPSDLTYKVSTSVSVGTQTHFTDDFLSAPGGQWDFLAIGDGTRALPGPVRGLSPEQIPTNFRRQVKEDFANGGGSGLGKRLNRVSKSFNDNWGPVESQAPLNQSYSLSIGNEMEFGNNPFGYLLNLNYGYSSSYYEGFQGRYRGPVGGGSDQLDKELLVDESKGTTEAKLDGLLSLNYSLGKSSEIGATAIYSRRGESTVQTRFGSWPEQFSGDSTVFFQDRNLYYTRRQLYSTQLRGRHLLAGLGNTSIEWNVGFSDTRQEEPDNRLFGNIVKRRKDTTLYEVDLTGFPPPTRFYTDLSENSYSGKLDISVPLGSDRGGGKIKVGGSYRTDNRSFRERRFRFVPPSNSTFTGDPEAYFSDENMGIIDTTVIAEGTPYERKSLEFGNTVVEETEPQDKYEGERTIAAGYAMIDVFLTERLRVVGGARVERTDVQVFSPVQIERLYESADTTGAVASIQVTDVLPSLNLVYELRDDMNLRLAGTRTLARPTFREIAPYSRTPNVLGEDVNGNPSLNRTLITNVDLRWEWFPAPRDVLAVSVFGKDFQDAIEVLLLPSTNGRRTWANSDARVYGAEFELRTGLGRFSRALQNVHVGTNLSLVHSEAEVPGVPAIFGGESGNEQKGDTETRPMEGQSPYTFNFDVSYENPDTGTNAGLFFNTFGERLTALGVFQTPNVFEQPFHQLNFTFSQRFRDHWTLDVSVENILGDTERKILPFRGNEFIYQRTPKGRSLSIGLSYEM